MFVKVLQDTLLTICYSLKDGEKYMKQRKQAEQSKYSLIKALLETMETKPFEDITIKELTEKAGVSRLTFYRHFQSKEEVILTHINYVFESYFIEMKEQENLTLKAALILCFSYWRKDERLAKLLVKHNLTSLLYKSFHTYLELVLNLDILPYKINHFQKRFIEGGLIYVMIDWIIAPKNMSESEMADLIISLISLENQY